MLRSIGKQSGESVESVIYGVLNILSSEKHTHRHTLRRTGELIICIFLRRDAMHPRY